MPNHDPLPGLSGDSFAASLRRFVADSQVDQAAAARSKERWLTQQLSEESGFVGTLTNLAESQTTVGIAITHSDILGCTVLLVGADFVFATDNHGNEHLITFAAINRIEVDSLRSTGAERRNPSAVLFWEAVSVMAEDRPEVAVHHLDGSGTRGELVGATSNEFRLRIRQPTFRSIAVQPTSVSYISTSQISTQQ